MPERTKDPIPETPTEGMADLYRPSEDPFEQGKYIQAKKDLTLGNFLDSEIFIVVFWANLVDQYVDMGLDDVAEMHAREMFWWINALRARNQAERKETGKDKKEYSGGVNYQGKAPTVITPP